MVGCVRAGKEGRDAVPFRSRGHTARRTGRNALLHPRNVTWVVSVQGAVQPPLALDSAGQVTHDPLDRRLDPGTEEPLTMKNSNQNAADWGERVGAWLGARWQWVILAILLVFALNNLVGVVAGAVGLLLFANRIAGRLLGAGRVVRQVREIVIEPDGSEEEG